MLVTDRLRFHILTCAILAGGALAGAPPAHASDAADGAGADSSAYFAPAGWRLFGRPLTALGDVRLTQEVIMRLPPGRPDGKTRVEETSFLLRAGAAWALSPRAQLTASAISAPVASSDADERRKVRLDGANEPYRPIALDRLSLDWQPVDALTLRAGQAPLPLPAPSLIWDGDLRPVGVGARMSAGTGEFNVARVAAGYWAARHVGQHMVRLAAATAEWTVREGALTGGEIGGAVFRFDALDSLARAGLGRQNRVVAGHYVAAFHPAAAHLVARTARGAVALEGRVDVVRNLAASAERDAVRGSLVLRGSSPTPRVALGVAYQSVEREAVLGAFASDEWWFRTRMTGGEIWMTGRLAATTSLRIQVTREHRAAARETSTRLLAMARAALP